MSDDFPTMTMSEAERRASVAATTLIAKLDTLNADFAREHADDPDTKPLRPLDESARLDLESAIFGVLARHHVIVPDEV